MNQPKTKIVEKIRIEGDRKTAIETGRNRLIIAGAIFSAAFLLIGIRVIKVSIFNHDAGPRYTRSVAKDETYTGRADIVDRNGVLLATSLNTQSLYAHPRLVLDPEQAAIKLKHALPGINVEVIEKLLRSKRGFVYLKRRLTPNQHYAVNRLGIPALYFQRETRRIYPLGPLAAHVLGHTDPDNKGLAGIERFFDKDLRTRQTALSLAIDARVQHVLEQEISQAMRSFGAIGGAGLIMNVNTAEVLAMASLPNFDPNRANAVPRLSHFNKTSHGVYEMGSTFKIFTTAMALELGNITLRDGYDATKPIRIHRYTIRDYHAKKRWLSVPEIFIYSSNIGAVKMAQKVGKESHKRFLGQLGMMKSVQIELFETGAPIPPKIWRDINHMTISYGHGIAVSPLHLVAGVSAIINGGIYRTPTIIKRHPDDPAKGKRIVSNQTSLKMRHLMRLVVEKGTGGKAAVPGYLVGGKTGTAEKVSDRGYKKKALISSFVAAFPMNRPQFVVLTMLDEAKGNKATQGHATGGWVAAPAAGAVIRRIAPILALQPIDDEVSAARRLELKSEINSSGGRGVAAN